MGRLEFVPLNGANCKFAKDSKFWKLTGGLWYGKSSTRFYNWTQWLNWPNSGVGRKSLRELFKCFFLESLLRFFRRCFKIFMNFFLRLLLDFLLGNFKKHDFFQIFSLVCPKGPSEISHYVLSEITFGLNSSITREIPSWMFSGILSMGFLASLLLRLLKGFLLRFHL